MTRLVQLFRDGQRGVALVDEPRLVLLQPDDSVYVLALRAIATGTPLTALAARQATGDALDYEEVYAGRSPWRLLPPIDHPHEWSRCRVSGTGLTHLGSAASRHAMHERTGTDESQPDESQLTDSMRMFRWGVERGRPAEGEVGVAPEWFHKGDGTTLRAHGEPLDVPSYAEDGGEEAEVAGVYVVGLDGTPWRVGMAQGNEFSDHVFERRNYLNLAGSKLRACALGPELVVDPEFRSVRGTVAIERDDAVVWSKEILTGEAEMCHNLRNVEHHHFKFAHHRRPGDVHVHYFGACSLSFADGVSLADGDVMVVSFDGFGRALRNRVRVDASPSALVTVRSLG